MRKSDHKIASRKGKPSVSKKFAGLVLIGLLVASSIIVVTFSVGSSFWQEPQSSIPLEEIMTIHGSNVVVVHSHVQLSLVIDGVATAVPANVGIMPTFHRDHSLDQYGVKDPQMAPLHTHESDGIIHIESTVNRPFTLGEFLDIWGFNLDTSASSVSLAVNGNEITDYRSHILLDGQTLVLEIQ